MKQYWKAFWLKFWFRLFAIGDVLFCRHFELKTREENGKIKSKTTFSAYEISEARKNKRL